MLRSVILTAVAALLTVACGAGGDIITSTPTPEPTPYLHRSGLACYGERSVGWTYNLDPDLVVGFPSEDEAATHWWQNESEARWWHSRDGTDTISAEDLTQHPSQDHTVAFRDAKGNAQIVVYAAQLPDGSWIIDQGTACVYFDGSNPKTEGLGGRSPANSHPLAAPPPRYIGREGVLVSVP